jgi:sec-independent protein translocase protein TatC
MIIPFSSRRRPHQNATPLSTDGANRLPCMLTALAVQLAPDDDGAPGDSQMGFLDHLDELRQRLIRALLPVAVGMLVAFAFVDRLVDFMFAPTRRMLPPGTTLVYTQPGEAFGVYINVALIAGVLLASAFVMFQVWRFIAPRLYRNEKKLVIPFVTLTSLGALGGAAFRHYVMFPALIAFFGTFHSTNLAFLPRLEDVFDLYTKMLVGMCAVFQIPTVAFFLGAPTVGDRRVAVAQFQVRVPGNLHRGRGDHAHR